MFCLFCVLFLQYKDMYTTYIPWQSHSTVLYCTFVLVFFILIRYFYQISFLYDVSATCRIVAQIFHGVFMEQLESACIVQEDLLTGKKIRMCIRWLFV